jgi:WD40 repeat protein
MKKLIFEFLLLLILSMSWRLSFAQETNPKLENEPVQHFTINEKTGAINGLDYLQLKPRMVTDRQLRINYESNKKNEKIWIDSTLTAIRKSKKIQQVGDYLRLSWSPNGKYYICVDVDHGGRENFIHFFDKKNRLIRTYKFTEGQNFASTFNSDGNCVILTSSNNDEFIFLNNEGIEIYKGSYNRITRKTNGALWTNVSSKGNFWIAFGQEGTYLGNRAGEIIYHISKKENIMLGTFTKNEKYLVLLSPDQILVFDLGLKKVIAASDHLAQQPLFDNMSIYISENNSPKHLYYDFE